MLVHHGRSGEGLEETWGAASLCWKSEVLISVKEHYSDGINELLGGRGSQPKSSFFHVLLSEQPPEGSSQI